MKNIISILCTLICLNGFSQSYNDQFKEICEQNKLAESKEFLLEWEKAEPENPEMFIGLFNYYILKSKSLVGEPNFLGGYLYSPNDSLSPEDVSKQIIQADSLFEIGQQYVNDGIATNPDRLDMYLGKLYSLRNRPLEKEYCNTVKNLVSRNIVNKGVWLWSNNAPETKSEEEFLNMLQSYIYHILSANEPDYNQILEISELALQNYPENYMLLSNIGICKRELGALDECIAYFKRGLASKPDDIIIRFNIAEAYVQQEKKGKARKYYEYIIKNGNEEHSKFAQEFLDKL